MWGIVKKGFKGYSENNKFGSRISRLITQIKKHLSEQGFQEVESIDILPSHMPTVKCRRVIISEIY